MTDTTKQSVSIINMPIKKSTLRLDSPCLCGSGKAIATCHLDFDGRLRKQLPALTPSGPKTGYAHLGCYLRGTCDCSDQISREHYMSKAVLDQLGTVLRVSGMHWQDISATIDTTVGNLTSKILCKRHNESLSPLDQEAALFFSALHKTLVDLERKTISRKPVFHLVDGTAIELWMLKVACGLYFGVGAKNRKKISEDHSIDMTKVERAFFESKWDSRAGLYFKGSTGSVINIASSVGMTTLSSDSDQRVCGAAVSLLGVTLELLFDTTGTNPGNWAGIIRRPTELVFARKHRQHSVVLTWPPGTPEASIVMENGLPPFGSQVVSLTS